MSVDIYDIRNEIISNRISKEYSKTKALVRLVVLFYILQSTLISGLPEDSWILLLLSVCCDCFD